MLPRASRVSRQSDIERIVRYGSRVVTPFMVIYWQQIAITTSPRIACVVGKKVHKLAVYRHRLQRLLRSLAAEVIPGLTDGVEMVWVGQPNLQAITGLEQLRQSIVSYKSRLPFKD